MHRSTMHVCGMAWGVCMYMYGIHMHYSTVLRERGHVQPNLRRKGLLMENNMCVGFGFRVSGFGFGVPGFGFRVWGLGFRVGCWDLLTENNIGVVPAGPCVCETLAC